MLKKTKHVRILLSLGLIFSIIFAIYSAYYKIGLWGFDVNPHNNIDVWTIEAHISFEPTKEAINVSIFRPKSTKGYKILEEDVVATGYITEKTKERIELFSKPQTSKQDIYYRVLLYDNVKSRGKTKAETPPIVDKPILEDASKDYAEQILLSAQSLPGDEVQKVIRVLGTASSDETVAAFIPERKTDINTVEVIKVLLAIKGIPSRIIRGIKLTQDKKSFSADVMVEAYIDGMWKIYDIETGKKGIPDNFVVFQRGGDSLVDVSGGTNSVTKFSVMKSLRSSFKMASHRAQLSDKPSWYKFSVYNLPIEKQNALKWLMVFPLAILIVVIMRNVVGVATMGTFTPMLISMSLVETGLLYGLICFGLMMTIGLFIRALLSKFNLLLVPRISAVVVFVVLIIQVFTILGYQLDWEIGSSSLFFPVIIMAWIIERASITWEEDGAINASKEIICSIIVAVITYFVIMNDTIRHIIFAFNEINFVILFLIMLLGTYTGYRLSELVRFAPLTRSKK